MNLEMLEKTWREQVVRGANEPAPAIAARLQREVAAARRRIRGGIVLAAGVLFLGWATAIAAHVLGIKTLTPLALAASGVQGLCFAAFIWRAFRSLQAVRREQEMMTGTLRESLTAASRTVEVQIENARIAAWAIPVFVAVNAWLCVTKYLAGELPDFGVIAGTALMVLLGAAIGAAAWHRYRTHLLPLREEVAGKLRALETNPD
jgi:hypothetical protein